MILRKLDLKSDRDVETFIEVAGRLILAGGDMSEVALFRFLDLCWVLHIEDGLFISSERICYWNKFPILALLFLLVLVI